jgi:hypothetical protein
MSELGGVVGPKVRLSRDAIQSTVTCTECHPVAPSGAGAAGVLVCV